MRRPPSIRRSPTSSGGSRSRQPPSTWTPPCSPRTTAIPWRRRGTADALAWALHKAGRNDEAIVYGDRAAALGWRSAALAYHRGMILAALGRTDAAAAALTDALRTNPYFSPLRAPGAQRALDSLISR
ncbi:hypothetical protein AB0M45_20880 [Nocardia sp. NPDC051787]|uniref:hypothetical protein n=1 Tax=Nocardia sp. NPDC051787 TaxID=3155415 RepID=UPI00341E9CBC